MYTIKWDSDVAIFYTHSLNSAIYYRDRKTIYSNSMNGEFLDFIGFVKNYYGEEPEVQHTELLFRTFLDGGSRIMVNIDDKKYDILILSRSSNSSKVYELKKMLCENNFLQPSKLEECQRKVFSEIFLWSSEKEHILKMFPTTFALINAEFLREIVPDDLNEESGDLNRKMLAIPRSERLCVQLANCGTLFINSFIEDVQKFRNLNLSAHLYVGPKILGVIEQKFPAVYESVKAEISKHIINAW